MSAADPWLLTGAPLLASVYSLSLSDGSGIPLTKLGNQPLTVVLPLPEALKGQEVKVLAVDRNGQLDLLEAERVLSAPSSPSTLTPATWVASFSYPL